MVDRPEVVTDEMLAFLDTVQESGKVNMWEAPIHLRFEYPELSKTDSRTVFKFWKDQKLAEVAE